MSARLDIAPSPHRFSRDEYDRMVDAGIFGPGDSIELLDGEIIDMAPQKSRHATAVTLLAQVLGRHFGAGHVIRVQLPLCLDDHSEPDPDIAVVTGSPRDYRDAHPESALLVVEVADTTLAFDRTRKLANYARAGIPEYWILDLAGAVLEVCRRPDGESYSDRRIVKADGFITPGPDTGIGRIAVADLLP